MLAQQLEPGMVVLGLAPGARVVEVVAGAPVEVVRRGNCQTWTDGYTVPVVDGPPITVDPDADLEVVDQVDVKETVRPLESVAGLGDLDGVVWL